VPKRKITCVTRAGLRNHEAIARVGGLGEDDEPFNITRAECADQIIRGDASYVVVVHGNVEVAVVAYERGDQKYIRTKPDQNQDDNLLSLPACASADE
jgi:Protein of unknown function (DUF3892)